MRAKTVDFKRSKGYKEPKSVASVITANPVESHNIHKELKMSIMLHI